MIKVLLLDGLREVDPATPVLRADDLGVVRGESVFETTRVVDGRPIALQEHVARLAASAARVDITLPDGFTDLALAAADGWAEASLRLTCSKGAPDAGPVGFAVVSDVPPLVVHQREHGVSAVTLGLGVTAAIRSASPWLLGGVKSTSYAVNMATLRHAHDVGADEAIWVSSDGFVLEAPTSTVGALVDGRWITPPAEAGILPGITMLLCQALAPFTVAPLTVATLRTAEEVVLLSSVRGVAAVTSLDGQELALGPAAKDLQQRYEASLRAEIRTGPGPAA